MTIRKYYTPGHAWANSMTYLWKMAKTLCISVLIATAVIVFGVDVPEKCQCPNPAHCNPIDDWDNAGREV